MNGILAARVAQAVTFLFAYRVFLKARRSHDARETQSSSLPMPYVVAEACINCKHTDCVEVCPVDCFYEGPNFLVIHPDECIDCNACVPVCPVEAIFADDELPEKWTHYTEWNAHLAEQWQQLGYNITEKKDPLPDYEKWVDAEKSEEDILTWEGAE